MQRPSGFTLVEFVVTLVVLGVLAAVALPRFFTHAPFQATALSHEIASVIRYGQKLALASRCQVRATVNATAADAGGTQHVVYALHYLDCVPAPPARVPRPQPRGGSTEYYETGAPAVPLSGSLQLVFDARGVPQGLGVPAVIRVGERQLTVEPGSGLVHVD